MAYQANKPQASDQLSQSQSDLLNNFMEINSLVALNHVGFNMGAESGKHNFLQMPVQAMAPTTNTTEMALYTKTGTGGVPQMFIRRQETAGPTPGVEIEFTSSLQATSGWTRLPSGLLLKWGVEAVVDLNALRMFSFPVAASIPVFSNVFSAQLTFQHNSVGPGTQILINLISLSTTQISYVAWLLAGANPGTKNIHYFVIGN